MSDQRARSLNAREVAALCGVDLETVEDWVEDSELKVFDLPEGGEHRIYVTDLVEFLNESGQPVPSALGAPTEPSSRRRGRAPERR